MWMPSIWLSSQAELPAFICSIFFSMPALMSSMCTDIRSVHSSLAMLMLSAKTALRFSTS